jgi:hypothetical protein
MRGPHRICKGLHPVGIEALTQFLSGCGGRELRHNLRSALFSDYSFGTQDSMEAGADGEAAELEVVHQGTDLLQV